ncbi:hypothetical protein DPMN_051957 [Dreissena polymorpha]|uniref:Uncharacterized protein n=1 Tax=Dreissena polymorpha TaxID=45954 RepID=A0A9D4HPD6_DREPO|nr:hypothetical protein DPMN_051957 [Dreissena polymorpha]
MGISNEHWRARIGAFTQPMKKKKSLQQNANDKSNYISLTIRILLLFILVAQCVERNPGTDLRYRSKQSKSISHSTNRATGRKTGPTGGNEFGPILPELSCQQPSGSALDNGQTYLSNWLNSTNTISTGTKSGNQLHDDAIYVEDSDSGSIDVASILLEIRREVKKMNSKFDKLEQSVKDLNAKILK